MLNLLANPVFSRVANQQDAQPMFPAVNLRLNRLESQLDNPALCPQANHLDNQLAGHQSSLQGILQSYLL